MNSGLHQVAECGIDGALALHAVEADEGGALDDQSEMAFAAAVMAGVTDVAVALIFKFEARWSKARDEALLDLGGDRASCGSDVVHHFTIEDK